MAESTEVPAAILHGKRKATEAETAELPATSLKAIDERFARERAAAETPRMTLPPPVDHECGSCHVVHNRYVQQCRRCAEYLCMGDYCITPADPEVMDFPPGSSEWRYLCNMCAQIQDECKRRKAAGSATATAETSPAKQAPKFKQPIVRNTNIAQPKPSDSSEEEHETEEDAPAHVAAARKWLDETAVALVKTISNVLYLKFIRKNLTKLSYGGETMFLPANC